MQTDDPKASLPDVRADRASRAERAIALLFTAWAVSLIVRGHLPYLAHASQQNIDEGYLLAAGQRMLHGRMLPFVDAVAHTGPVFMWLGALIASFGSFSWLPVRIAAVVSFSVFALLLSLVGRRSGRPLAGAIAAAFVPMWCVLRMRPIDGIAFNAELPVVLFALASLLCVERAVSHETRRPGAWAALAGMFGALSVLSKQIAVLIVLPIALRLVMGSLVRDGRRTRALRTIAAFVLSGLVPLLVVLGTYASAGALHELRYYVVTYNNDVYMHFARGEAQVPFLVTWLETRPIELLFLVFAIGSGVAQIRRARLAASSFRATYERVGFPVTIAALAVAGLVGARASLRNFDHYYIVALPWFALLLGLTIDDALARTRDLSVEAPHKVQRSIALLLSLALSLEGAWSVKRDFLLAWSEQRRALTDLVTAERDPPACALVREHSDSGQSLFVWGFRPELYVSCGRRPASRFVFTTFVAGFVPWYYDASKEQEDRLAVPGSRALLLRDLEDSKPPVLIDAGRSLGKRSMRRYEQLADYLDAHYRPIANIEGDEIYVRRAPSEEVQRAAR